MSKAPGSVDTYDGSGDWFKVYETGLCGSNPGSDGNWCSWQKDRLEFTIPENIPAGEYLVRAEHIGLHEAFQGRAQFYMECAQLKIEGSGIGTPQPLVQVSIVREIRFPRFGVKVFWCSGMREWRNLLTIVFVVDPWSLQGQRPRYPV